MWPEYLQRLLDSFDVWALVGFLGQLVFASRFVVQWIHAERVGRSEIPLAFWFLSVAGGVILLFYAVQLANIVFIVGQVTGLAIYLRNLHLILQSRRSMPSQQSIAGA
ncbi:lipid-A-disaccharide synthase N-terminal domain-containing protein [uncultured Ferrovibrio sp.]|jgi:Predicted membrane protein|uniref:lipid-A-disaccharide synthase N-terminal domain-containing protein n=1 Tax=uncultured Ferrovibrio sp. TaxID=1576913 RepID=UPI002632F4E9|nr:lipid-A-disaccharide synthase N-terminal domain-containing protein [uncultured Ferrovibrio sp.]